MSIICSINSEEFKNIVLKSYCIADICEFLGLRRQGGYYRTIQRRLFRENINTLHFKPLKELLSNKRNRNWISKDEFLKNIDNVQDSTRSKKLVEFNLIPHICEQCKISNIWNDKPLKLQLDHIDGNHTNNKLSNLRFLCPNCHSQTDTFCGKHKKTKRHIKLCNCGKIISHKSYKCRKCASKENGKQFQRIPKTGTMHLSKELLLDLIQKHPFVQIGKMYNVSDNAIRKWCKKYNLPYRKKDLVGDIGIEPMKEVCNTSSLPLA